MLRRPIPYRALLALALAGCTSAKTPWYLSTSAAPDQTLRVLVPRLQTQGDFLEGTVGLVDTVVLVESASGVWSSSLASLTSGYGSGQDPAHSFIAVDRSGREYASLGPGLSTRAVGGPWTSVVNAPAAYATLFRAAFLGDDDVLRIATRTGVLYETAGGQVTGSLVLGSGQDTAWAPTGPRTGELLSFTDGPSMLAYTVDCTPGTCTSQTRTTTDLGRPEHDYAQVLRTAAGTLVLARIQGTVGSAALAIDGGGHHLELATSNRGPFSLDATPVGTDGFAVVLWDLGDVTLWLVNGAFVATRFPLGRTDPGAPNAAVTHRVRSGVEEVHVFFGTAGTLRHSAVVAATGEARTEDLALPP